MRRLAARKSVKDHVDRQRVERPLVELRHRAAHLHRPGLGWRVRLGAGLGLELGLGPGSGAGLGLGSGLEQELGLRFQLE